MAQLVLSLTALLPLLRQHAKSQGFDTSGMKADIAPGAGGEMSVFLDGLVEAQASDGDDDEGEEDNTPDGEATIVDFCVENTLNQPKSLAALAAMMGHDVRVVARTVDHYGNGKLAPVAPVLEEGQVRSKWMATGTPAFEKFTAEQKVVDASMIAKFRDAVLSVADTTRRDRADLVERVCQNLSEDDANLLRTYNRTVLYGLAEENSLYHSGSSWSLHRDLAKKVKDDAERRRNDLALALCEVLTGQTASLTIPEVQALLPGAASVESIFEAASASNKIQVVNHVDLSKVQLILA